MEALSQQLLPGLSQVGSPEDEDVSSTEESSRKPAPLEDKKAAPREDGGEEAAPARRRAAEAAKRRQKREPQRCSLLDPRKARSTYPCMFKVPGVPFSQ